MKDSGKSIKEQVACGHEVAVTINNLDDLLKASNFDIAGIKKAIKGKDCPACASSGHKKPLT